MTSIENREEMPVDLIWVKIFKATPNVMQLEKIDSKVLEIPISNAFIERIFSMINNLWTAGRNRVPTCPYMVRAVRILEGLSVFGPYEA
jgi:hypothetical protein